MDRDTPGREQTLRFLAAPTDAGYSGSVSGGRVMEWIDRAGYACAAGWSRRYCVTVYVGNVRFTRPVAVGDLVEATARLVHTGRTSMHILVTVRSGSPRTTTLEPATECLMVFVAVGEDGRPTAVPELPDGDDQDRAQKNAAVRRIDVRAQISAAMAEQSYTEASTAPRVVLRFLAAPSDVNWGGKVHGGIVMRWIDEAAHVLVTQWIEDAANVAVYATSSRSRRGSSTPGTRACTSACTFGRVARRERSGASRRIASSSSSGSLPRVGRPWPGRGSRRQRRTSACFSTLST